MSFPEIPQQLQCALGQRHVTIPVALAGADMKEHAFPIDVTHLQSQPFSQPQAAGVNGAQANTVIQEGDAGEDLTDFTTGEHDGQFELGIGPHQFHLRGPATLQGLFPEKFDRANRLSTRLAGDFLFDLEVEEVLAEFLRGDQVGGFLAEFTELAQAVPVPQDGALGQGQQAQIVEVTV